MRMRRGLCDSSSSSTPIVMENQNEKKTQKGEVDHICECLKRISSIRPHSILLTDTHILPTTTTTTTTTATTRLEFVERVQSLALGLFHLGLKPGHIVAIAALNSVFYLEWMFAVPFVGAIIAPLNYRWSFKEARSAMENLAPVMLVLDESCATWYSELRTNNLPSLRWHVCIGDPLSFLKIIGNVLTTEMLRRNFQTSAPFDYRWAPEGVALICFTSGTSGKPKGVAISHTALIIQSLAKIAIVGYNEDDVYLHTAPLCHIGGISSGMAMLMVGARHILLPKFEAKFVLQAIEEHNVSSLITVPAMMADLISLARSRETWKGRDSLKKILNGGGGLSVELVRDAAETFPNAHLLSAYGMTETCSSLTFITLYEPKFGDSSKHHKRIDEVKYGLGDQVGVCVGKPAPHVELWIHGNGPSSMGRILTRGPHVMLKYWNENSTPALDCSYQGWLDTGDIGWIDDLGNVWLVGRSKDRIKSGGENVHPEEVEDILSHHPGVSSAVVVGIPDLRLSEMVTACVQIKENWEWVNQDSDCSSKSEENFLSSEILHKYCQEKNLTRFKIPKAFILWRKPFPKTSIGKLRREEVKREAISHIQFSSCKL